MESTPSPRRWALRNRWAVLVLLFFTRATIGVQFQSVPPVTPYIVTELGLSYAQVGWLIGLFSMPGLALALLAGLLATRVGDRRVILLGLVSLVLGAEAFAFATGFTGAFVGRLMSGVGFVLVNLLMMKIVTDHFAGRELSTAMGVLMTSWPIGISVAMAGLGALAEQLGWRSALHAAGALSLVALVAVAVLLPATPPTPRDTPDAPAGGSGLSRHTLGLLLVLSVLWGLYNAGFAILLGFAPTLLGAQGHSDAAASALVSLTSWVWVFSLPLGGYLADRLGRLDPMIVTGGLLAALLLALLPLGYAPAVLLPLIGLAFGAAPGAVMALPAEVLRPAVRSIGFGVFYTAMYFVMAGLPPVAGWLLDRTGHPGAPVWFAGALYALMLPALAAFRVLQRRWAPRAGPVGA